MTGANVPFAQRIKQSTGCLFFFAMVGIASVSCEAVATDCRYTPARTGIQRSLPIDVPFTVASWNIRKGIDNQWIETMRDLSNPADLVLLQEGYIPNELERLGFLGSQQWFAPGYLTANKQTGVLTAARVDVLLHCQLTAMEPWLGTPKAMAVTDFAARGSEEVLRVINVHGVNFELGEEHLTAQLQMLQPYFQDHKGPLILAGDFNTFSLHDKPVYDRSEDMIPFFKRLDVRTKGKNLRNGQLDYRHLKRIEDAGFVDLINTKRKAFIGTFPTPLRKGEDMGPDRRLDYVFANPKLAATCQAAACIVNETTGLLSDHQPVTATFELTAK